MVKKALEKALPPVFARCHATRLSGGLINGDSLANKMSRGEGPEFFKIGRKVGFSRDIFLEWIENHIEIINGR